MRDTIDMAREAGFDITYDPTESPPQCFVEALEDQLKAFEALVRADQDEKYKWNVHSCGPTCTKAACVATRKAVEAEREACAQLCEDPWQIAQDIQDAIRARGETK